MGTTENIYLAAGKPEVRTKLNLVQLILMAVLMYPLTMRYSRHCDCGSASFTADSVFDLQGSRKIIGESFTFIARTLVPGITGSLIMVLAIYAWQYASASFSPVLRLAVSVVLGSSVYVAFIWMTRRELFYEVRELITRR